MTIHEFSLFGMSVQKIQWPNPYCQNEVWCSPT